MPVSDFIAHHVERVHADKPAVVNYRQEAIVLDDHASQLLNEIKQVFSTKTAKRYGQFNPDLGDHPVAAWLKDYSAEKMPFASLSQRLTEHFVVLLDQTELPFQGYLLFWQEANAEAEWLYAAHLQQQVGLVINSHLEISQTQYADLSHVGFCGRVNLSHWRDGLSDKYLTISKNRGDRILQELFNQWIGFTDTVNSSADTSEFLNIVEAYAENLPEEDSKDYRDKVVDYCIEQDKQGEPVVYKELSYYLDENEPERFQQFIQEQQPQKKDELIPDKTQLRKYVRFSGRSKEISIQFAASLLGEHIEFDAQKEQLVIKQLPKSLLSQLKKHRS
ncbi:nucleoid-associated protein [Ketobacter sp.]